MLPPTRWKACPYTNVLSLVILKVWPQDHWYQSCLWSSPPTTPQRGPQEIESSSKQSGLNKYKSQMQSNKREAQNWED